MALQARRSVANGSMAALNWDSALRAQQISPTLSLPRRSSVSGSTSCSTSRKRSCFSAATCRLSCSTSFAVGITSMMVSNCSVLRSEASHSSPFRICARTVVDTGNLRKTIAMFRARLSSKTFTQSAWTCTARKKLLDFCAARAACVLSASNIRRKASSSMRELFLFTGTSSTAPSLRPSSKMVPSALASSSGFQKSLRWNGAEPSGPHREPGGPALAPEALQGAALAMAPNCGGAGGAKPPLPLPLPLPFMTSGGGGGVPFPTPLGDVDTASRAGLLRSGEPLRGDLKSSRTGVGAGDGSAGSESMPRSGSE
mmetsp:Transcript_34188/g.71482  ORF Transcript_34188/g.71482 Transcript_34188/m.71482 type:complete len:313 (+) Transcript_34188:892-1830(+)